MYYNPLNTTTIPLVPCTIIPYKRRTVNHEPSFTVSKVLYFAAIFCRLVYEHLTIYFPHFRFGGGCMKLKVLSRIDYNLLMYEIEGP